jgi:uncharacterized membrane protein YbhN (UPF0104 family)
MNKRIIRIALALLVTGAILFVFFRKTGWGEIREAFASIPLGAVGLYMAISLLGAAVRSVRYRVLLSGRIGRGELFLVTLVQNFSVDLLPARSASLVFYTYLTRRRGILLEEGVASFVIAVFYDALALGLMLGAAAFVLIKSLGADVPAASIAWGLTVIVAVSLLVIILAKPLAGWARKISRRMQLVKIAAAFATVEDYFSRHGAAGEKVKLLGLSFIIKLVKYVSLYVLFVGVSGAIVSPRSLSLFSFGVAGAELSSFLPIQGLAGLGTWEAAFALVAGKIGLALKSPFLTALVIHLVTQVWEYGLGLGALWILSVRARGRE